MFTEVFKYKTDGLFVNDPPLKVGVMGAEDSPYCLTLRPSFYSSAPHLSVT